MWEPAGFQMSVGSVRQEPPEVRDSVVGQNGRSDGKGLKRFADRFFRLAPLSVAKKTQDVPLLS